MANQTENYKLTKPLASEFYDVEVQNGNMDKLDKIIAELDPQKIFEKESISENDALLLADSENDNKAKRVLWSSIKSTLSSLFVPLTRKINNKALSSDVTLTGADIQVSGTDNTKIDAALSNKAEINEVLCKRAIGGDALNATYPYLYATVVGPSDFGPRSDFWYVEYYPFDEYAGIQVITSPTGQDRWYRTFGSGVPNNWEKIATATSPQEYDLPLQNGWITSPSDVCKYSKDQFGIVHIALSVIPDNPVSIQTTIGTLPVGFRPRLLLHRAIAFSTDGALGMAVVTASGELLIYPFSDMRDVTASIFFVATD